MPQQVVGKNGGKVWEGEYFAFGGVKVETGSLEQRLRFAGQYYDEETNNYYNYFRTYDPATGRYLESDPIGLNGGLNTYLYASANPLYFIDPMGFNSCSPWIPIGYGPDQFRYDEKTGKWSDWNLVFWLHERLKAGGALLTCDFERYRTTYYYQYVDKEQILERTCTDCEGNSYSERKSSIMRDDEGTVVREATETDSQHVVKNTPAYYWWQEHGPRARGLCVRYAPR
jgi:RHS repeat-associated protein